MGETLERSNVLPPIVFVRIDVDGCIYVYIHSYASGSCKITNAAGVQNAVQ